MVRGQWVRDRSGQRVWRELAPDRCGQGHPGPLLAGWGGCPVCRVMGRQWRCRVCDDLVLDPEHVHRGQPG